MTGPVSTLAVLYLGGYTVSAFILAHMVAKNNPNDHPVEVVGAGMVFAIAWPLVIPAWIIGKFAKAVAGEQ